MLQNSSPLIIDRIALKTIKHAQQGKAKVFRNKNGYEST